MPMVEKVRAKGKKRKEKKMPFLVSSFLMDEFGKMLQVLSIHTNHKYPHVFLSPIKDWL